MNQISCPTRRSFLGGAAAGLLGSGWWAGEGRTAEEKQGCGLGIGTYGLQSMGLAEAIRLIAGTGYDCAEITAFPGFTGDPEALSSESRKGIRELLKEKGLRLSALMADLHPEKDDEAHAVQLTSLRRLIDLGRDFSPDRPPLIQTVLGGKDWEESRNLFRDRLADWIQVAADQKVVVAIKPHRSHAMSRPADAGWLIGQLGGNPWLRMVYDYSHYDFREPEMEVAATVAESLPWTAYVASKDAVKGGDGKVAFALAGDGGSTDHAQIIRAFHSGGYRGDFCCEVSSQIWKSDPGYDPVEATRLCYRNMEAAFERAGVPRR